MAVRELEKLEIDPIEKVYIYHRFNISRAYLVVSYAAIVTRQGPLSLTEGRRLGLDTSLKIAEARENLRSQITERSGVRSPSPDDFDPKEVDDLVRQLFEVPARPPSNSTSGSVTNGRSSRSNSRASSFSLPSSPPTKTVSPPPGRAQQSEYDFPQSSYKQSGGGAGGSLMRGVSNIFSEPGTPGEERGEDMSTFNSNSGEPSRTSVTRSLFVTPSNINSFVL